MGKHAKLVMVAIGDKASSGASQNNKYYDMIEQDNATFKVEYGRIGVTKQEAVFPMNKWDSTYRSKVKKGYKDVTSLYVEDDTNAIGFADISDAMIATLISRLQAHARKEIVANYNISSEKVTQRQCEEAQNFLNELVKFSGAIDAKEDIEKANKILLELYQVIPRRMSDVRNHLLSSSDSTRFTRLVSGEQSLLDTMTGQVKQFFLTKENCDDKLTILDAMGLVISIIGDTEKDMIREKLQNLSPNFLNAFKAINKKTQKSFDEYVAAANDKKTDLLWHGSRNENWLSILESGLIVRPTNAVYTGSMFGDGCYFADKAQKSFGYTSSRGSYWARGSAEEAYMALYNVHLGNQYVVEMSDYSLNALKLKEKGGFDSTFARAGRSLMNNEYIVYNSCQSTVQYIVQMKG